MLNLGNILFPIYQLSKYQNLLIKEPFVYIYQQGSYKLLDDKSKIGNLAQRRLKYEADGSIIPKYKLAKINKPIFRYSDIFPLLEYSNKFIDSNGKIIEYKKTEFQKIKYYKISKFVEIPTGYYIVVHNIHARFYLNRAPSLEEKYAGIIEIDKGYILYELVESYQKERRVKL